MLISTDHPYVSNTNMAGRHRLCPPPLAGQFLASSPLQRGRNPDPTHPLRTGGGICFLDNGILKRDRLRSGGSPRSKTCSGRSATGPFAEIFPLCAVIKVVQASAIGPQQRTFRSEFQDAWFRGGAAFSTFLEGTAQRICSLLAPTCGASIRSKDDRLFEHQLRSFTPRKAKRQLIDRRG